MIRHHLPENGFVYAWMWVRDPAVLEFLDASPTRICGRMAKNAVLKRVAETGMRRARQLSQRSGRPNIFTGSPLQSRKWPGLRRASSNRGVRRRRQRPKDIPGLSHQHEQSPQWIYEHVYCQL